MKTRLFLPFLVLAWPLAAMAAEPGPAADRWAVLPLAEVDLVTTPAFDRVEVAREDEERDAGGLPWRYALPEDVQLTPGNSGTWETLPDGHDLWRLRLVGPGALSMNLGFLRYRLPPGARLLVYAPGAAEDMQVYDERDNAAHGELWTPVVLGHEVVVELEVTARDRPDVALEIGRVNRGYRLFGEDRADKSGACNVDVVCPEGDPWRDEIDTVGMISLSGTEKCTGFMVNNTARDGRPLFITAAHCLLSRVNDQTLVVYWNYQSPVCGQQGGGSKLDAQTGSTWLATTSLSDFTIVELDDQPDPAWNVKFAGWNRSTADPTSAVAIHHPSTDEKSISFENDPLTTTTYFGDSAPGNGTHLRVEDWDVGTTEPGSSGSPLFDQDGYVVGELHGGRAACGLNLPDWYGRLSYAWAEGSADSTRLRDWLDPLGTGQTTLGLYDPLGADFAVSPEDGAAFTGPAGGPFAPVAFTYTLDNTSDVPAPFTVDFEAAWISATPATGTIPVAGRVTVEVAPTASAAGLPVGTHVDSLLFWVTGAADPLTSRRVSLVAEPDVEDVRGPIPNPFVDFTEIQFSLNEAGTVRARILDIHGRLLRDLGERGYEAGVNRWAWNGTDGAGRRLAAGLYVFELVAEGQTRRFPVTFVR